MTVQYQLPIDEGVALDLMIKRTAPQLDANGDPVLDANRFPIYLPVDMTGWVARFAIRPDFDQPEILLVTEDSAGPNGWVELGNGFFSLHLSSTISPMKTGYVYDVLIGLNVAGLKKVMAGTIKVKRTVAR